MDYSLSVFPSSLSFPLIIKFNAALDLEPILSFSHFHMESIIIIKLSLPESSLVQSFALTVRVNGNKLPLLAFLTNILKALLLNNSIQWAGC